MQSTSLRVNNSPDQEYNGYLLTFLVFLSTLTKSNRGKWLGKLAMFFVVCFCMLFWGLTVHKTWQNTKGGYLCS